MNEEIDEKMKLINKFIDEEFFKNIYFPTLPIFEEIVEIGKNCKEEVDRELNKFEKQILKNIGILIDRLGKMKGIEQIIKPLIEVKYEIIDKLKICLLNSIEKLENEIKNRVDEIFMYLKKHKLGYIFNLNIKDFEELKSFLFSDIGYFFIQKNLLWI